VRLLASTESLCPFCFRRIPARITGDDDDNVYLMKSCPTHGTFKVKVWSGVKSWMLWDAIQDWEPERLEGEAFKAAIKGGCPFDCGLCPAHLRKACFVVMEVTNRCDLTCPVCFADANRKKYAYEPDLDTIRDMYETILKFERGLSVPSVQISGGEPTVREDLPEIISIGKKLGLNHILLDTNGLRIAGDPSFLQLLKESGLDTLYLQFDGVSEDVYLKLRGRELMRHKVEAVKNCMKSDVGVVLVPTVVRGVNFHQIGGVIEFAMKWMPTVRGIMFQPMSHFGRYPHQPSNGARITVPDMLKAVEEQMNGKIRTQNFVPIRYGSGCESHCGFACMIGVKGKEVTPFTYFPTHLEKFVDEKGKWRGPKHERGFLKRYWSPCTCLCKPTGGMESDCCTQSQNAVSCECKPINDADSDCLSIGGMHFQDAWNIDMRRVKKCCIHVVTPGGYLVPFCLFNVTTVAGDTFYRDKMLKANKK